MFISYYRKQVSIALQCAQAIATFQQATTLSHDSSSLPHVPTNAPSLLADFWLRMPF
jgi:hypothetical protein